MAEPAPAPGAEAGAGWDAVVVGAGIGGLVCAAYLAAAGLRVLVLEHHDIAGGNAHVFRRRREFEFDVGVHYLGDCGPGGLLPAILSGLGLSDRVRFAPLDDDGFDLIELPGLSLAVPTGWDRYRARLVAELPASAAGIDTFVEVCSGVAAEQRELLLNADADAAPVRSRLPFTMRWGRRSLASLFDHCALSAAARAVLSAQSPDYGMAPSVATVSMHAIVVDHYLRGAYYPVGGGQDLVAALVEALEAHGGQLRTRCRAERILVEDGRVTSVVLEDGSVIRTPCVVSNADYRRTVLDLVGAEHFPPLTAARAQAATMALPWTVVYVALDRELPERPNANLWWYRDPDIEGCYAQVEAGDLDTVPFLCLSFASLKDARSPACPPGRANFQAMTLCPPPSPWWGVADGPASGTPYRRLDSYRDRKRQLTASILDAAEAAVGPFRNHIVHLEAATPLTHERYIRSSGGTPYGVAQWGTNGVRPDTRTEIDGLYLVGASTRYGNGIAGVAVGGTVCAGQILGQPLLPQVHGGEVLATASKLPDRGQGWDPFIVSRGLARREVRGPRRGSVPEALGRM